MDVDVAEDFMIVCISRLFILWFSHSLHNERGRQLIRYIAIFSYMYT